jgi:ATP-dependent protease ClpP protease subunit
MSKPLARAYAALRAAARPDVPSRERVVKARVENAVDTATVYIYDELGGWGIWASELVPQLDALEASEIVVRLNSPGGDYFDGTAIANALAEHPARVTVHVDGYAASAASVVAMAGDEIVMHPGSRMMIHDALTMTIGNAAEHMKTYNLLDSVSADIAELYASRSGQRDGAAWRNDMLAESWYSADEAVTAGLATRAVTREGKAPEQVAAKTGAPTYEEFRAYWRAIPQTTSAPSPAEVAPPAVSFPTAVDLSELVCSALTREAVV